MKYIFFFICSLLFFGACIKEDNAAHNFDALEERAVVYDTLLKFHENWLYWATNATPPGKWTQSNYSISDSSAWRSGNAELGYGDSNEVTVVPRSYLLSKNANMTTYFRKNIFLTAAQVTKVNQCDVYLHRDDGAVVYVNGAEKIRSNMPAGVIKYSTPALDTMEGAAGPRSEHVVYHPTFQSFGLKAGWNIIAVEIHQFSVKEKDMSFNLNILTRRNTN